MGIDGMALNPRSHGQFGATRFCLFQQSLYYRFFLLRFHMEEHILPSVIADDAVRLRHAIPAPWSEAVDTNYAS
jgi:hypothetical protein